MESITLTEPITRDGMTIDTITLRRPKVGDIRRMDKVKGSDLEKTLWMIGALTDLSPDEVDALDASDLNVLAKKIEGFTNPAEA